MSASTYFPPLDHSLAGEARLISWRTAYRALCDEPAAVENIYLEKFFQDDETIAILSNSLRPFAPPNSKSATAFETMTAPINVSHAQSTDFKLDDIKADAKWLSKELQIDEMAALRLALIEWQERPADQLLNTAFNGSSGQISQKDNTTGSALARSTTDLAASTSGNVRPALNFTQEDVRRQRLLEVYLSEKNHMLRLSADLVSRCAVGRSGVQGIQNGVHTAKSWIDPVAVKVAETACPRDRTKGEAFISQCIAQVAKALDDTDRYDGWPEAFRDERKIQSYIDSLYCEVVSVLRLLFAGIYTFEGILSASTVLSWFRLMEHRAFLRDGINHVDGTVPQLLVSVVSVEILKLQLVVAEIMNTTGVETTGNHQYINDDECVASINLIMYHVGQSGVNIAAPAMLAWSIIVSVIKDMAHIHRDVRDREHGSDDTFDNVARRGSARMGSLEPAYSQFERLYANKICNRDLEDHKEDPPKYFLTKSVDGFQVFNLIAGLSTLVSSTYSSSVEAGTAFMCKETLLDVTREGLPLVKYDAEVLGAVLSFLTPIDHSETSKRQAAVLADRLLTDLDQLRPAILGEALSRFPYELSPLLRISTALANAESRYRRPQESPEIADLFHHLQYFTQEVPTKFRSYQLEYEEENANAMVLTDPLSILAREQFSSFGKGQLQLITGIGDDHDGILPFSIPAGTHGTIVKEKDPMVLMLHFEYSGLDYLSALLYTFTSSSELTPVAPRTALDRFGAAEIIDLFSALLSAALQREDGTGNAQGLLERLSQALGDNHDIVSIVADIFETELLAHFEQVAQEGSLEVVTAAAEFINVIIRLSPERVWSMLARSSLLGLVDGAMSLVSVVNGIEVQTGHFRFLKACVDMHALLLDDAFSGLVKRQPSRDQSKTTRFAISQDSPDTTPARTMSAVLSAFQKILLDAFQSLPDWKFAVPEQRCQITSRILNSFTKLLKSTYGVDVAKDPSRRLTYVLAPAADSLVNVSAPRSGPSQLVATLSRIFPEGLPVADDALPPQARRLLMAQTTAALQFIAVLIRVTRVGGDLLANKIQSDRKDSPLNMESDNAPPTQDKEKISDKRAFNLAAGILKSMPTLASLLASDHALKADVYVLLGEIVQAIGTSEEDPPSVLAQLDTEAAQAFLQVVTQLDRPLCDIQVERRVWDFMSIVMGSKQQWFAIYLLTGKFPKSRAHRRNDDSIQGKPIIGYVLDQLSNISVLPPERAVGMLKFVSVAQQTWVWATNELRSHPDFIKNTLAWLETLRAPLRNASPNASVISARECEMASYLCETYAINLHASLEIGDKTMLKALVPKLGYLRDHGVSVDAYNRAQHMRLEANIKATFPSSELSDFKRTAVNPSSYGTDYFYDRDMAESIFRHSEAWQGKRGNDGYVDEFIRANANISLLHAQIALLKSWKTLATTLCEGMDADAALPVELAKVAEKCLLANARPDFEEPGMADSLQLRIELAFVLISRLVSLKIKDEAVMKLLPAAWDLVATSPVDYDVATAPDDMVYYRQLLQVLYLSIQPHHYACSSQAETHHLRPQTASTLMSIVGKVISPGFRALCSNLHNDLLLALPADFALLTALLQAILSVPGINSVQTLLADIIAGSSVVRAAVSLYSWADQLADDMTNDPIYGEIAVMFLLALSGVRPIAEQMALQGVLAQLASGNLSNYLRKPGGKGPFDEPHRMFVIWTNGFLPLCLNLLDSVGPPIASEVAAFLNSFRAQLARAESSLVHDSPSARNPRGGAITLSLVTEAHSLTMIALILQSDAARGAAEGIDVADLAPLAYDAHKVKELAEGLSRSRRSLAERIRPVTPLEERWMLTPVVGGGAAAADHVLQEKVLRELLALLACFGGAAADST
jgi:nuclear pore complex protein Nup188